MNIIDLAKLSKSSVLAGSSAGRQVCKALLDVAKISKKGLFVIDCLGVEVATSSFLREAVIEFRRFVRREIPDVYPVLSHLEADVEEELAGLLNQMSEAFWVFELNKDTIKDHRMIGRIDQKLRQALDLIEAGHGYDAATLWKTTSSTELVGVTAWNNRLASLSKQGLVFESRVGKLKYFRPLHECRG